MNVTCGKDFISILVDEEFFKYYNVGVEAVHLINASCRAHREEISGSAYFTVHTPMDQYTACGGTPLEVKYCFSHLKKAFTYDIFLNGIYSS